MSTLTSPTEDGFRNLPLSPVATSVPRQPRAATAPSLPVPAPTVDRASSRSRPDPILVAHAQRSDSPDPIDISAKSRTGPIPAIRTTERVAQEKSEKSNGTEGTDDNRTTTSVSPVSPSSAHTAMPKTARRLGALSRS
jgi:hypothetical protein